MKYVEARTRAGNDLNRDMHEAVLSKDYPESFPELARVTPAHEPRPGWTSSRKRVRTYVVPVIQLVGRVVRVGVSGSGALWRGEVRTGMGDWSRLGTDTMEAMMAEVEQEAIARLLASEQVG